jgi:hypothetical protein
MASRGRHSSGNNSDNDSSEDKFCRGIEQDRNSRARPWRYPYVHQLYVGDDYNDDSDGNEFFDDDFDREDLLDYLLRLGYT